MDDLVDHVPCGIVTFRDDGTILKANATLLEMLGRTEEEIVGRTFESILSISSRIFHQTHLYPLLRVSGRADEIFLTLATARGPELPVLANTIRKKHDQEFLTYCAFIPLHERKKFEDELIRARREAQEALKNNEQLRQAQEDLETHARELDRKVLELEQKNSELLRLSSILSHDLREPIRKASLFADMLLTNSSASLEPVVLHSAERIRDSFERLNKLLTHLQHYLTIGRDPLLYEVVELDAVVDESARRIKAEKGRDDIEISHLSLPSVEGDRQDLVELFYHLIDNAVKFAKPGAAPRIRIDGYVVQHNSFRAISGKYRYIDFAQITVEDNGIGFERRYSNYVLGVLKKLDPETVGIGIGLSICRRIVELHNGSVSIDSEPNVGTTVRVLLPVRQS